MQRAHTVRPAMLTPHCSVPFAGNVEGAVPVRLWHHSPALQQQALKCLHAWLGWAVGTDRQLGNCSSTMVQILGSLHAASHCSAGHARPGQPYMR